MKIYHGIAGAALLALAGVAQAQVGGVPAPGSIGSPSATTNGGVGSGLNTTGDRAVTGRDAIGAAPGTPAPMTPAPMNSPMSSPMVGATPPIAATPSTNVGGMGGEATSGTAATKPAIPPR